MTLSSPFVAHRPSGDLPFWRVIAGGDSTAGQITFGETVLPPGAPCPPRHVHTHEDEAILVVSGVLTVHLGDDVHEAGPGALVWMARQVPHHFANNGDQDVHAFGTITPSGLEKFFEERDAYLSALTGPPDPEHLLAMNARYGVHPA